MFKDGVKISFHSIEQDLPQLSNDITIGKVNGTVFNFVSLGELKEIYEKAHSIDILKQDEYSRKFKILNSL